MHPSRRLLFVSLLCFLFSVVWACRQGQEKEAGRSLADPAGEERADALPTAFASPADNPTTPEKIELGRALFYDPILSGHKDVACASCHHPEYGYAEGLDVSVGVGGRGLGETRTFGAAGHIPFVKRNAHTILNTAFNGIDARGQYDPARAPMFWDLRVESLERQALEPIKTLEEMRGHAYPAHLALDSVVHRLRAIPRYRQWFSEVFGGGQAVDSVNLGKALAAFERSLVANNSRFDQYMRGDSTALSATEREGYQAFIKTGCVNCHNGPMFSDFRVHVLGIPDNEKLGQPDAGTDRTFAFRTPSLRNLRYTDPYMHSGKLQTVEQVLEFYEDLSIAGRLNPHVKPEQLDPLARRMNVNFKDIRPIAEFLTYALNDDHFDRKIPPRVPSGLPVGGNIQRKQ
jgi:cytochrome c peroxidase